MAKFDFQDLARVALNNSRTLIPDICPGGEIIGREYTCGSVNGGQGTSCKINVDSGRWSDFATGEKGGDLISLWAASYGLTQLDAAKAIATKLRYKMDFKKGFEDRPLNDFSVEKKDINNPYTLTPVPESIPSPTFLHYQFGNASAYWLYRGRGGERLFWIARYDTKDGKQFVPYSWCSSRCAIIPKAWPSSRPIYGLELLYSNPNKAVLIVEGEKAADAARNFIPSSTYIVVSWSGGSQAFTKTDWSPLHGRRVLIWPDNDLKVAKTESDAKRASVNIGEEMPPQFQPGVKAAIGIAELLADYCEVKYFSLHDVPLIGEIDGFDAADAYEMVWDWNKFKDIVVPIVMVYQKNPAIEVVEPVRIIDVIEPNKEEEINPTEVAPVENKKWVSGSVFSVCDSAGMSKNVSGKFNTNMSNVKKMIEFHPLLSGKIWFDDFHMKILTNWKTSSPVEWGDADDLQLCDLFQDQFGMHGMNNTVVRDGVRIYANSNRKNEPVDWIKSIQWDGESRIKDFFTNAFSVLPTIYTRSVSENFWVAMIARVLQPGVKFDHMIILEGDQGSKKSSGLEAIAGEWYGNATGDISSKDFYMCLQGKMIVEIAELSGFKASDVETIKKMITVASDRFRPPYGAAMVTYKRTSVFVGTTNQKQYLNDDTGARRFWPVKVGDIDIDYIKNNRSQMFSEALVKFKEGHKYWEMPQDETKEAQESRRIPDMYEEIVGNWLSNRGYGQDQIKTEDVAVACGFEMHQMDHKLSRRISGIMRVLGWENKIVRSGDQSVRRWVKRDEPILN